MKISNLFKKADSFISNKSRTETFENTAIKYGDFPKLPNWFLVFSRLKGFLIIFVAGIIFFITKISISEYKAIIGLAAVPATLLFIFVRSFVLLYQKYVFYKNSSSVIKSTYVNAIKKDTIDFVVVLFIGIVIATILSLAMLFLDANPQYQVW
jgi:hypothetical protein